MPYFEHNGTRVYYEERGEGESLLALPGFTESSADLEELISELAHSYRVVAADLPGSGRSEPIPREYKPDFYLEDAHTMAALLRHLGLEGAHVLGFSDGGEVALLMAVHLPDMVSSLVEWGAAGTLGTEDLAPLLEAIGDMIDNPTDDLRGWSDYLKEQYGQDAARATMRSWAGASQAILAGGGDISLSQAHEIRCPALLISGELDPFATPAMTNELASRIPNAQALIVPGVGHTVHHDQPEWFHRTVLDWLRQV